MKTLANYLRYISKKAGFIANKFDPPPPHQQPEINELDLEVQKWNSINGERTLRITYELNKKSIVFDIGGYEGQWASDIFSKYQSEICVFEPIKEFYENISERFSKNKKIRVFPFGLGSNNQKTEIYKNGNVSSTYMKVSEKKETVQFVCISDFIYDHGYKKIDLMKINIEGGEFELLEHLIEKGFIGSIENIQVQFHEFVENAKERRATLQSNLRLTHKLTYEYPFVWENWARLKLR